MTTTTRTEYACVLADPPWPERGGGKITRGANRHYQTLTRAQSPGMVVDLMLRSPVWHIAPNAHLWLWVTNNYLRDGLAVMEACGFRYVTNAVWAKDRYGLGQYMRGQHELLLFGVRGRLPALTRSVGSLVGGRTIPRTKHSRKPQEAYSLIESVSPGPRVELFARSRRAGWDVWGNEAPTDDEVTP